MSVATKLCIVYIALLPGLIQHSGYAQQLVPRLVRQFSAPPGVNLRAGGMSHDTRGTLWMASEDGVVRFDGQRFRVFHDPVITKGDYYYHTVPTPDGRVWLKMGRGHSLSYVDPRQQRIVRLPDSTRLVRDYLAKYGCHYLFADERGILWIGLRRKGLVTFDPRTLAVEHVVDQPLDVRGITQDRRGVIYFTTTNQGLFTYTPQTGRLANYRHDDQDTTSLSSDATFGVQARFDGTILIGISEDVDLLTPATGKFRHLRLNQVPVANSQHRTHVVNFQNDRQANTWFSTGLATYRYTNRGVLQWIALQSNMGEVDDLHIGLANQLWVSALGTLYEYDLTNLKAAPDLIIQQVSVNGSLLTDNTEAQSLVYDTTGHPTLTVPENAPFTLHYTLLAHKRAHNIRQRLNDYDRDWKVGDVYGGIASYRLPAGTYTFTVNGGRGTGGWQPTFYRVAIVVKPPIWKSAYALTLLLLLVGGAGYFLIRTYLRRQKLQRQLLKEQLEAANLRQLDEFKTQFFANVTHELRTPLTIILNATEQLGSTALNPQQQERLESVQRNAHQLLRLVNETLDMAKLDAGKLHQNVQFGDPLAFVEQMVLQFTGLASQKGIDLHWNTNARAINSGERAYYFDDNKLEKIVYNLLSNALKFTPAGGAVQVDGQITEVSGLRVRVADTGIGIAADQLGRIFERFHQVDGSSTRAYSGTGIGLAFVRELTEWLGGHVTVTSEPGQGSVFTIELPLTQPAEASEAVLLQPQSAPKATRIAHTPHPPATVDTDGQPLVLVVEDNTELRAYVADALAAHYRVVTAENGQLGLDLAIQEIPDLIVSDVMMPELDGFELVEQLKADERTSHVPVILLTAKSSYDSRMKGLSVGADEYLGKPFSLAELALRVGNCLRTRQNWQHWLSRQSSTEERIDGAATTASELGKEERFLDRLRQRILDHLDQENLDVDWLAAQATMSRTQLHRKLTALTALSPNRFIHRVRVEKAAELLQAGELNVAQAAFQVGYSSPSHFSKVFQEHMGYPPARLKA